LEKRAGRSSDEPRFHIAAGMSLVAGAAVAVWLAVDFERKRGGDNAPEGEVWIRWLVFALGGLSLVGPPLLLWNARKRPWGAGRLLWFVQGTATWLLWPPAAYRAVAGLPSGTSVMCYFWGTPPMALYVTITLLAGGYLKRSRRRRMRRSWQEMFGLLLGLVWACTGLYVISLFYRDDILPK
jgi:hypothetical protein